MRLKDLVKESALKPDVKNTMSPTMVIPALVNSDTYKQYRYTLALASARAHAAGEVPFDIESAWNESLAAVAYTPADQETIEMANKMMGVEGVMISDDPSHEPDDTNTASPVMAFNMFEGDDPSRRIRKFIDLVQDSKENQNEAD